VPVRAVDSSSLLRHLLIASVILGFSLDVLPTPTPGAATSGRTSSGAESPFAPRPDDSEQDETPDEAGDLSWPLVRLVDRAGGIQPPISSPNSCDADLAEFDGTILGPNHLPRRHGDGRDVRSSVALSVLLCRLIC
jgi:hypothetical protein